MFIQNAEKIFAGYDLPPVLNIIILKKSKENLIPGPLTQALQKMRTVEIDSMFVIIVILSVVNGDVNVAFRLEEVNSVGPPP